MITKVGLYLEKKRKKPWLVTWWGPPDPDTRKQRKYKRAFGYKREAQVFHAEKQTEIDREGPREKPQEVTLVELIEEFKESRLARLSYSSRTGYGRTLDQMIEHFGAGRNIQGINQRHAETFMATRKRVDGRPGELASWTLFQHLKHAKVIFAAAVEWGYLDRNPFVSGSNSRSTPLRVRPKSRPWHHLTPDEFERMLAVVSDPRHRAAYWCMYGCGLRPGEVYNLRLENIDIDARRIHVQNRVGTEDVPPFSVKADGESTENKARSVPIPEAAIPDLILAMQGAFKAGGFVVLSEERYRVVQGKCRLCREGKPWSHSKHRPWQTRDMMSHLLRITKSYLREAGIELSGPFTLTTFRKSFAQNHANHSTPPKTLAKILGHSDTRVTIGVLQPRDRRQRTSRRTHHGSDVPEGLHDGDRTMKNPTLTSPVLPLDGLFYRSWRLPVELKSLCRRGLRVLT